MGMSPVLTNWENSFSAEVLSRKAQQLLFLILRLQDNFWFWILIFHRCYFESIK